MGMPVESPAISVNSAENADIQRPFSGGIQQVIDGQAAEVVKQPAVDLKQRPQRIGQGEDEMYPVAVRQAVKLSGNPEVSGLFPQEGQARPWQALVIYLTWWQSGLSQPYSFTPVMRVPQASILVTASTSISRRPPASRKEVQH